MALSASETRNLRNINRPVADSLATLERLLPRTKEAGLRPLASVATSFGCPYEGRVPAGRAGVESFESSFGELGGCLDSHLLTAGRSCGTAEPPRASGKTRISCRP